MTVSIIWLYITPKDIVDARRRFKNASDEHDIVVGDAPGKITEDLKQISDAITHGIVVCTDDIPDEVKEWEDFFKSFGVDTVATVISKEKGSEEIVSHNPLVAIPSDLNRERWSTMILKILASLIRLRLGV